MSEVKNILLSGVGGQGIILASKVLAAGLIDAGYDVKMSEVHGMAQRGGSVTTQVRFGKKVYSPIIGKGQADILVSFEEMETVKWMDFLKPSGKVVVNDYRIPSAPILIGDADYPEGVIDKISELVDTTTIKAGKIAKEELGNILAMNIVLLGALVKGMGLDDLDWDKALKNSIKPKYLELNKKAFEKGLSAL